VLLIVQFTDPLGVALEVGVAEIDEELAVLVAGLGRLAVAELAGGVAGHLGQGLELGAGEVGLVQGLQRLHLQAARVGGFLAGGGLGGGRGAGDKGEGREGNAGRQEEKGAHGELLPSQMGTVPNTKYPTGEGRRSSGGVLCAPASHPSLRRRGHPEALTSARPTSRRYRGTSARSGTCVASASG